MSIKQQINLFSLEKPQPTHLCCSKKSTKMSRTKTFEWHKMFREEREDVKINPGADEKVYSDPRLTVRLIDELSINSQRVRTIIMKNLGMRKISAKILPKLLNENFTKAKGTLCASVSRHLERT